MGTFTRNASDLELVSAVGCEMINGAIYSKVLRKEKGTATLPAGSFSPNENRIPYITFFGTEDTQEVSFYFQMVTPDYIKTLYLVLKYLATSGYPLPVSSNRKVIIYFEDGTSFIPPETVPQSGGLALSILNTSKKVIGYSYSCTLKGSKANGQSIVDISVAQNPSGSIKYIGEQSTNTSWGNSSHTSPAGTVSSNINLLAGETKSSSVTVLLPAISFIKTISLSFALSSGPTYSNRSITINFVDGTTKTIPCSTSFLANETFSVNEPDKQAKSYTYNYTAYSSSAAAVTATVTYSSVIEYKVTYETTEEAILKLKSELFSKMFVSSTCAAFYKYISNSYGETLSFSYDNLNWFSNTVLSATAAVPAEANVNLGNVDSYKASDLYIKISMTGSTGYCCFFELTKFVFTYTEFDITKFIYSESAKNIVKFYNNELTEVSNNNVEKNGEKYNATSFYRFFTDRDMSSIGSITIIATGSYTPLSRTFSTVYNGTNVDAVKILLENNYCTNYRRMPGQAALVIQYSDSTNVTVYCHSNEFGVVDQNSYFVKNTERFLEEIFINPNPSKTITSMTYTVDCLQTMNASNVTIYALNMVKKNIYKQYSTIELKLPKEKFANFQSINNAYLHFDTKYLGSQKSYYGVAQKNGNGDIILEDGSTVAAADFIPTTYGSIQASKSFKLVNADKSKDISLIFIFRSSLLGLPDVEENLLGATQIVIKDITIEGELALDSLMPTIDVANNYIPLATVTDNYVPKSIVERDYRKVFFVNNAKATKGSFEDRIKLTWLTTDTAIKYNIYKKNQLGDFVKIGEVNDGTNTYYDMNTTKGTHYFYKISAVNSNVAESEKTSELEGYCNDIINSVKDVEATSGIYEDKVIVTWRNDPLADSYTIYRKKAAESGAQKVELGVVPKNTIMFEDTTVPTNEVYFYYVKATSTILGDSPECYPDTGYRGIAKAGYRLGRFVVGDNKNNLIYDLGFKS